MKAGTAAHLSIWPVLVALVGVPRLEAASMARAAPRAPGLVVENVAPDSASAAAGVRNGDLLIGWRRAANPPANRHAAAGRFETPFDLQEVELEQSPRGEVTLEVERESSRIDLPVPTGKWKLEIRPRWSGAGLDAWLDGERLLREGEVERGLGAWRRLAALSAGATPSDRRIGWWLHLRIADALAANGDPARAHGEAESVAAEARERKDAVVVARVSIGEAERFTAEGDPEAAERCLRAVVAARRSVDPDGLALASALSSLGMAIDDGGNLDAALELHRRALEIRERRAPGSLALASTLNSVGLLLWRQGDLDGAEVPLRRSLTVAEGISPANRGIAAALNSLGNVVADRGDLRGAEELYRRCGEVLDRISADPLDVAASLDNLCLTARTRGNLVAAEESCRKAFELRSAAAPDGLPVAASFTNLGTLAADRGDSEEAASLFRRALEIEERLAPGGLDVALDLTNLAIVLAEQTDRQGAEWLHLRALEIRKRLAPESLDVAWSLDLIGDTRRESGDLDTARELHARSLAIRRRLAPGSIAEADSIRNLGLDAEEGGDLPEALRIYSEALPTYLRLSPDTVDSAQTLRAVARTNRRLGWLGEARDSYCEALRAIEAQSGRLGGSPETRSNFSARFADWYREAAALLVELGESEEAFHVLERSRARELLAMISERDLLLGADLPPELERERARSAADYDRALDRLGSQTTTDLVAIEQAEQELRTIRARQQEVRRRLRAASPRLSSLVDPVPLDLDGARRLLDPGTLLLDYSVGESESRLFLLPGGGGDLLVRSIPVGRRELASEVDAFRRAIRLAGNVRSPAAEERVRNAARKLGHLLLDPAAAEIRSANRLLVVPDGPLHFLPFAALEAPGTGPPAGDAGKRFDYVARTTPVHTVVSMTVYGELLASRPHPASRPVQVVAFGDPLYPSGEVAGLRGRGPLSPLPATRAEVESLRALSPETTVVRLGPEATEAAARAVGRGAAVVHFACHGLLDERFPLDSGLAFTPPDGSPPSEGRTHNGLLQAWEIFEGMRLDADLVTLSACETAMGKEEGGEGLVGLVRAFEYAGARSVLASLWSVGDESTASLMASFYRQWRSGVPKDEALRRAQTELMDGEFGTPFHWAAFELVGDFR